MSHPLCRADFSDSVDDCNSLVFHCAMMSSGRTVLSLTGKLLKMFVTGKHIEISGWYSTYVYELITLVKCIIWINKKHFNTINPNVYTMETYFIIVKSNMPQYSIDCVIQHSIPNKPHVRYWKNVLCFVLSRNRHRYILSQFHTSVPSGRSSFACLLVCLRSVALPVHPKQRFSF